MAEGAEGGAAVAWRLLATLEGGSLLLGGTALLAYTARARLAGTRRRAKTVLITNISNPLGRELKKKLEARRCTVSTVTSGAASGAASGAGGDIDALVIVGSEPSDHNLDCMAQLVTEDLLEPLSQRLRPGGCIVWACAGATSGAYSGALTAFDGVLRTSLQHLANMSRCEAIWIGRCESAERAAERTVAELTPSNVMLYSLYTNGFSFRNAAHKVSEYVGRWLKIIT